MGEDDGWNRASGEEMSKSGPSFFEGKSFGGTVGEILDLELHRNEPQTMQSTEDLGLPSHRGFADGSVPWWLYGDKTSTESR